MTSLAVRCEQFLRRRKVWTAAAVLTLVALDGAHMVWRGKMGDFKPLHEAAVRLREGEALYEPRAGRAYQYSPAFAFLLVPLGLLPLAAAKAVWYAVGVLSIAAAWRLAARLLWPEAAPAVGFHLLMLCVPLLFARNNLLHGQSTPLLLMLALMSYDLDARGRPWLAGACLAAGLMVKPFPAIFLLFYLLRRRWRTALAFGLVAAAILAAPAAYFQETYPAVLRGWYDVVRHHETLVAVEGHTNQSVTAFWYRLFGVGHAAALHLERTLPNAAVALSVLGFVGASCWRAVRATDAARAVTAFSLFMICWAALPPYGWKHYYVTLLLPCGVLAKLALENGPWGRAACRMLVICLLTVAALHIPFFSVSDVLHRLSAVLAMGTAIFVFLVAHGGEEGSRTSPGIGAKEKCT